MIKSIELVAQKIILFYFITLQLNIKIWLKFQGKSFYQIEVTN